MANKKIFMSVTATAVIASAFVAAEKADAASYKVKGGDSLWAIAQKYNTTVSQLKSINKLSGDIIYPNQILETEKKSGSSSNSSSNSGSGSSSTKPAQPAKNSTTYTVKIGDTLSGIASKYKISLNDLMKWNNLDTTLIFPGNVFVVSKSGSSESGSSSSSSGSSGSSSGNTNSGSSNSSGSNSSSGGSSASTVYTVKSGDTLSHIASRNGVTVANLKKWNNLKSDLILIGQKLSIGEASKNNNGSSSGSSSGNTANTGNSNSNAGSGNNVSEKPTESVSYNIDQLVDTAKSLLGIGYVWGGQTVNGFDCSGFIHYVYNLAGRTGSRLSTDGYYSRSYTVDQPQIGDLVFFQGTYRDGISHMGIYVGNNEFIHAGTSTGVTITNLNNSYWSKHFDSFKRFY